MDTPMAAPVGAPEETPAPAPAPAVAPEPEPIGETPAQPQGSDWREPESIDTPLRYLSGRQRQVIADTLRAHGRHMVKIESSYGDPASQEFAEDLGEAFAEADWMVRGIEPHRGLPLASGVTVSAGSFPPKPETRAVYEALLSAGIPVTQQLDPKQQNAETIILVGTPL
jgi:hypothetical protein